jgi:hypothetical protein
MEITKHEDRGNGNWKKVVYNMRKGVHIARFIARNPYTFVGCYEIVAIMDDSCLLCHKCLKENYGLIIHSTKGNYQDGWEVTGFTHSNEMEDGNYCSHCNKEF